MMNRALKIVEIAWVVVAVISLIEIVRLWGTFDNKFWMFAGCMVVAIFMFFLRRRQRVRYQERSRNQSSD